MGMNSTLCIPFRDTPRHQGMKQKWVNNGISAAFELGFPFDKGWWKLVLLITVISDHVWRGTNQTRPNPQGEKTLLSHFLLFFLVMLRCCILQSGTEIITKQWIAADAAKISIHGCCLVKSFYFYSSTLSWRPPSFMPITICRCQLSTWRCTTRKNAATFVIHSGPEFQTGTKRGRNEPCKGKQTMLNAQRKYLRGNKKLLSESTEQLLHLRSIMPWQGITIYVPLPFCILVGVHVFRENNNRDGHQSLLSMMKLPNSNRSGAKVRRSCRFRQLLALFSNYLNLGCH